MSRVLHFGVVDGTGVHSSARVHHAVEDMISGHGALNMFTSMGTSFTDYDEPVAADGEPVHVIARLEDFDRPLTHEEAREFHYELAFWLPPWLRLVDYWIDSDEVWGEDEHIHGLWALESISGRRL